MPCLVVGIDLSMCQLYKRLNVLDLDNCAHEEGGQDDSSCGYL